MQRTDFATRHRISAMGGESNPFIIHDSNLINVEAYFAPNIHVVFDSTCRLLNYNQEFGLNVVLKCSPQIEPFDHGDAFARLESIGTSDHPIVFTKELFWRCEIDCNMLHVRFFDCRFIECTFVRNDFVSIEMSPFATVDDFKKTHTFYLQHEEPRACFEVRVDDATTLRGYVAMTPIASQLETIHDVAQRRASRFASMARDSARRIARRVSRTKSETNVVAKIPDVRNVPLEGRRSSTRNGDFQDAAGMD